MKFILLIFLFLFQIHSEELEKAILKWKKIPNAKEYKVEIQNKKGFFKKFETDQTELKINLSPGIYEYRVGVINKFGKVKNFSKWEKLEIIYTTEAILETKNYTFYTPDKEKLISLKGKFFLEEMKIFLNGKEKKEIKNFERISENEINFKLDLNEEKEENLNLILINPLEKTTEINNFIILKKSLKPIISSNSEEIILPTFEKEFILKGENFTDEMKIYFIDNETKIFPNDSKILNDKEAKFKFNFENETPKKLKLVLENPLGKITEKENFLILKDPAKLTENSKDVQDNKEIKDSKEVAKTKKFDLYPPLWRSAIFPGWGQFYKGENTKAYIFAGSTIVLLGLIYYFEEEKQSALKRSNDINNRLYFLPSNQNTLPIGLLFYSQANSFYEKAEDFESKQNLAIYGLIGLWSYNLFDIYKNRKEDYPTSSFIFNMNFLNHQKNSFFLGYQIRF